MRKQPISTMLVIVLSTLTLITNDSRFIQLKPKGGPAKQPAPASTSRRYERVPVEAAAYSSSSLSDSIRKLCTCSAPGSPVMTIASTTAGACS
jgi:hypothetical protein